MKKIGIIELKVIELTISAFLLLLSYFQWVFHTSVRWQSFTGVWVIDRMCIQDSRTLLSIRTDVNDAVV